MAVLCLFGDAADTPLFSVCPLRYPSVLTIKAEQHHRTALFRSFVSHA